jgi:NAD kinase
MGAAARYEKIVLVYRKTRLAELIERFCTRGQAKFCVESAGGDFGDYEDEDAAHRRGVEAVLLAAREVGGEGLRVQTIERAFLPTFLFTEKDLVVVVGQDGLVANAARYVGEQPILGVNPDPRRIDGVLVPFGADAVRAPLARVLAGEAKWHEVTLAEARLADGQRLLAFNDLFVGARTHVSARYRIAHGGRSEAQSSSGVIVSTGAGSTGWLSSVFNMAAGVTGFAGGTPGAAKRLAWDARELLFVVREPFVSRHSTAGIVAGAIAEGDALEMESRMPEGGVIFGDGVESDCLAFAAGAVARIGAAAHKTRLVGRHGRGD